jgi:hypothetical protein
MAIKECTKESYYEMLEVLPPEVWTGKGFLVEEPHDFRKCRATTLLLPTYAAFFL